MCVTTSTDGFIKMHSANDLQTKKSFFVCQSGITACCALMSQGSFAIAGVNNEIYLFSFYTGTTIKSFYAHDDEITQIITKSVVYAEGTSP